jgi:hypothetical protein
MIAVPEKLEGLFEFERDLLPDLKRIPMVVRYKLDLVGLKVSLTAWNRLSLGVRKQLITEWPVRTHAERAALKEWLINWLRTTSTRPLREFVLQDPPWEDRHHLPEAIAAAAAACTPPLTLAEWSDLELLQRFALVKLARSPHERSRVPRALAEFRQHHSKQADSSLEWTGARPVGR